MLALRSHPQLHPKVQSGFWLVLTEKSDSGFPVVNLVVRQLYFDGLLNSQSLAKIDSQKLITPHSAAQSRKKDSSFVLLFSPQVYY